MNFLSKFTAFQLDSTGSLFSFYNGNEYILIEARLPIGGLEALLADMSHHNRLTIDVLHITSWDADHCTYNELIQIINHLRPAKIEVPDYIPISEDGKLCRNVIFAYDHIHQKNVHNVHVLNREYLSRLNLAQFRGTDNVVFESMYGCDNKNDMSLIMLFRSMGFNVLSLGDCESAEISRILAQNPILVSEVDVLILAHHGANNGFTTGNLLDRLNPKIAICSSNYDNQFNHPRPEICALLHYRNIPLMTTKRGNVIIYQVEGMESATAANLAGNNEIVETRMGFVPKRIEPGTIWFPSHSL